VKLEREELRTKNKLLSLEIERTKQELEEIVARLGKPFVLATPQAKTDDHKDHTPKKEKDKEKPKDKEESVQEISKSPKRTTSLGDVLKSKHRSLTPEKERKGSVPNNIAPKKL